MIGHITSPWTCTSRDDELQKSRRWGLFCEGQRSTHVHSGGFKVGGP